MSMKLDELMSTKPEDLAAKQFTALVDYVELRLADIAAKLRSGHFNEVEKMLDSSPSGDCNGCDHHFIDFSDTGVPHEYEEGVGTDIWDILTRLKSLKGME
jgi:hypothetical protein